MKEGVRAGDTNVTQKVTVTGFRYWGLGILHSDVE